MCTLIDKRGPTWNCTFLLSSNIYLPRLFCVLMSYLRCWGFVIFSFLFMAGCNNSAKNTSSCNWLEHSPRLPFSCVSLQFFCENFWYQLFVDALAEVTAIACLWWTCFVIILDIVIERGVSSLHHYFKLLHLHVFTLFLIRAHKWIVFLKFAWSQSWSSMNDESL